MRHLLLLLLAAFMLQGCQNHDTFVDDKEIPGIGSEELTDLERLSLLDNFDLSGEVASKILRGFEDSIRSQGEQAPSEFRVLGKQEYAVNVGTRSYSKDPVTVSSAIYKMEMRQGDLCGYALVSGDARAANVIAYVPDTTELPDDPTGLAIKQVRDLSIASHLYKIATFEGMKDALKASALKKLQNEGKTKSVVEKEIEQVIAEAISCENSTAYLPLTKTAWGQGSPYNCKLSCECLETPDGKYKTGCGVVAIAQAMAYYEPRLAINGTLLNWKRLKRTPTITKSSDKETINDVGFLMKWIGEEVNAEYTCEGTKTRVNSICKVLDVVNMQCDKATGWDWNEVYSSLKQGNLVHVSASDKNVEYAWIADGFLVVNVIASETIKYLHNNFGCSGFGDGYYEIEPDLKFNIGNVQFVNRWKINPNIKKK